ncbi:MAG: hypothetical protein ACON5A_00365 [Candidatus Comchoanobacterales bacterium]
MQLLYIPGFMAFLALILPERYLVNQTGLTLLILSSLALFCLGDLIELHFFIYIFSFQAVFAGALILPMTIRWIDDYCSKNTSIDYNEPRRIIFKQKNSTDPSKAKQNIEGYNSCEDHDQLRSPDSSPTSSIRSFSPISPDNTSRKLNFNLALADKSTQKPSTRSPQTEDLNSDNELSQTDDLTSNNESLEYTPIGTNTSSLFNSLQSPALIPLTLNEVLFTESTGDHVVTNEELPELYNTPIGTNTSSLSNSLQSSASIFPSISPFPAFNESSFIGINDDHVVTDEELYNTPIETNTLSFFNSLQSPASTSLPSRSTSKLLNEVLFTGSTDDYVVPKEFTHPVNLNLTPTIGSSLSAQSSELPMDSPFFRNKKKEYEEIISYTGDETVSNEIIDALFSIKR